eukprot:3105771-Pyramimonas_sp.AAC.1
MSLGIRKRRKQNTQETRLGGSKKPRGQRIPEFDYREVKMFTPKESAKWIPEFRSLETLQPRLRGTLRPGSIRPE